MEASKLLDGTLRAAANNLRKALDAYWPSEGRNEVQEATPLLSVAHAFRRRGFFTYGEVQVRNHRQQHVDLLAFSPSHKIAICIEAKRLFSARTVSSIADDWDRLEDVRLPREHTALPRGTICFRAVVGTAWRADIADWWANPGRMSPRWRHPDWARMAAALRASHRGVQLLGRDPDWGVHSFLYAFRQRKSFA